MPKKNIQDVQPASVPLAELYYLDSQEKAVPAQASVMFNEYLIRDAYFSSRKTSYKISSSNGRRSFFLDYIWDLNEYQLLPDKTISAASQGKLLHNLLKILTALMAIGLNPKYRADKALNDNSGLRSAQQLLKHCAEVAVASERKVKYADALAFTERRLDKISRLTLQELPYEILRVAIYFEIQRLEKTYNGKHKAGNLRELMHSFDLAYDPLKSSTENYALLKAQLHSDNGLARSDLYTLLSWQRYGCSLFKSKQTKSLTNVLAVLNKIEQALSLIPPNDNQPAANPRKNQ